MNFSAIKNKENIVILKALANSLFKCDYKFDEQDVDWNLVHEESKKQTVAYVCFDGIADKSIIPSDVYNEWFSTVCLYMRDNAQVNSNHAYLDKFLKKHGVPYCIFKGAASEYYYPNPALRAMGDVDFVVPKDYFESTSELFTNEGFTMSEEDHICHRVLTKNKIHLELHFEPAGMPEGENRKIAEEFFADIFEKTTCDSVGGFKFENPSAFHHGLVMLLHTYHHLLSEGIGLRHLCDWAVFVNKFTNEEFIGIFKEKLVRIGLWKFAQILSATACDYIGLPHREWIGDVSKELTADIICDIFAGGNFGNKDTSRVQEGSMISNRGKDGVKGSKFFQLVKVKNKEAARSFPIFKKVCIFYPFGFAFLGIRYFFNVITGKRDSVDIKKISDNAEKRKNIYAQFELFEKGE